MADPLRRLVRLNRTSVFVAALAVALAGLFLPGWWGAMLLYAVVAGMALLLNRTWPVTPPGMRVFRLLVLAVLAAIATSKIL
jgi:hypothetical protein